MALIDDLAEMLREMVKDGYVSFSAGRKAPNLLREYDEMKQQQAKETKLTEEDLTDEPSDYTALNLRYEKLIARIPSPWVYSDAGNINAQEE